MSTRNITGFGTSSNIAGTFCGGLGEGRGRMAGHVAFSRLPFPPLLVLRMNFLLEFGQSSRAITADVAADKLPEFFERELRKLDPGINLVIGIKSQQKAKPEHKVLFLQRFSKEWKQFVDVIDVIELESGDRLKSVPFKWQMLTS